MHERRDEAQVRARGAAGRGVRVVRERRRRPRRAEQFQGATVEPCSRRSGGVERRQVELKGAEGGY